MHQATKKKKKKSHWISCLILSKLSYSIKIMTRAKNQTKYDIFLKKFII